jgi:hypothetical protein
MGHRKSKIHQKGKVFYDQHPALKFMQQTAKCNGWSTVFCGAENRPVRKVVRNYAEDFEMWCWRRMETICWTDCVRNEVLRRVKESKIEWTSKCGIQRKQVIDDLKEMIKYWKLKEETIDPISGKFPLDESRDLS